MRKVANGYALDVLPQFAEASLGTFGNSSGMYINKFTVSDLPAGQQRYGISIGQNRGTIWFSEKQMRSGPGLSLGC